MDGSIEGFEDIHQSEPYIDADCLEGSEVAFVFLLYVPPHMRGQGVGCSMIGLYR